MIKFSPVFLAVLLFVSACSSSKQVVVEEPTKPEWVVSRPIDNAYYIGISVSNKLNNPLGYRDEAKRSALNELASEIEVTVNSNSMLYSVEKQGQLQDEFRSFTQLKTNTQIENAELVADFETSTEYWMFYRLSKAQYQADKQKKIDKAIGNSRVFLEQGVQQVEGKNYRKAMQLYIQSLEAVAPYINEQLKTDYNGQEVYWGAKLLEEMASIVQSFQLVPNAETHDLYWGQQIEPNQIGFILTQEGKPVQNIPIFFTYSEDFIRPRVVMTDGAGVAFAKLGKLRKTKASQFIGAHVDLETIYQEMEGEKEAFISEVLTGMQAPDVRAKLQVRAPRVYVSIKATEMGAKSKGTSYRNAIEEVLNKYEYDIVSKKSSADLVLNLSADTKIVGKSGERVTANTTGQFKVEYASGNTEVFAKQLSSAKGVQLDDKGAALKSSEKVDTQLKTRLVPQFHRTYLK